LRVYLYPVHGYAWQYIFAIVAFSIKLFCSGTKQAALISSESDGIYDPTRLSIEAFKWMLVASD
jgi:hypothetical protein